ncbi:endonuclease/exonuclease/phosphatase family protein [Bacillus sp. 1P10SD]|uniref:endonuclease/exonuclease/phosphatase family protein n=1 Tax=Bacillus sp. 1P10SD TaxID=3132265 RepID=UPI0039A6E7D4
MELCIMTFNLRVDIPSDGENKWLNRAEKVAEMIVKHNPIIICIQEALSYMLTDIINRLDAYQWIGQGREAGNKGEFSAILYKKDVLKVIEKGQFWLSEQEDKPGSISWGADFPRICTWGLFQSLQQPEKEFYTYNTHLDHISQEAREKGVQMIWDKMSAHHQKTRPAFLTGDFNATPNNNVIKFLKSKKELIDAYSGMQGEVGSTFHSFLGGTIGDPIDYIFTTPNVQLQKTIVDRSKVNDGFPSDHYPVILKASI